MESRDSTDCTALRCNCQLLSTLHLNLRLIAGIATEIAHSIAKVAETTAVTFISLSDKDIAAYIATGEPMDKAGAYAIQGRAARWIPRIEGDYFNVVGLPIALVSALLDSR